MGTLLFILAVVVEVGLVALCLRTKSDQTSAKGLVSIGSLAGFALLVCFKVIPWDMRVYALSALLLGLAVLGVVNITLNRQKRTAFQSWRVVLRAIGMTALLFLVTLPAILFPEHGPLAETGPYQVSTATFTYVDTNRIETFTNTGENRKLTVGCWYPGNAEGKYPLVVFSHGGISQMGSNESLYRELASHGYVVASINHTYHAISTTDVDGHTAWIDRGYLHELMTEDAKTDRAQSYAYYQKWLKVRMDDINFVIDYIVAQAGSNQAHPIYGHVDTGAIGVMGHSAGGSAALGVGRVRSDVDAVIALESPFMYDITGVENGEFVWTDAAYPVPVLDVYSDNLWGRLDQLPQYAQNYALLSGTQATAFNVHISGVGHFSLTDLSLTSPFFARMLDRVPHTADTEDVLRKINRLALAFFDSYLKHAGTFTAGGTD